MSHFFSPHTYIREAVHCCLNTALVSPPFHYPAIEQLMLQEAREMERDRGLSLRHLLFIFCTHDVQSSRAHSLHIKKYKYRHIPLRREMQKTYLFLSLLICIWKERRQYFLQPLLRCSQLLHSNLAVVYLSFTPAENMLCFQPLGFVISYTEYQEEKMQPLLQA